MWARGATLMFASADSFRGRRNAFKASAQKLVIRCKTYCNSDANSALNMSALSVSHTLRFEASSLSEGGLAEKLRF